ncbi:GNAT family N-acetyltransferase [Caenimonas koreensis]|uniref:GNAT family N-acetyltransferase n=1 Tax=Caenimonas koreensis TaxID=367474 RepID=UPI003782E7CC
MAVTITPITLADVESFRECLDSVAREGRFLALLEAPPLANMQQFVAENIAKGVAQRVAKDGDVVVGWCDIMPGWHHTLQHCGSLGMGLLPAYRGQGLGARMLDQCIEQAMRAGITRVELEVRADNHAARRLYGRFGFEEEGTKRRGMRVNGEYFDTVAMALLT